MKLMERVKKAKKNKKGFTLVELIVVIVILGILAAILVPSFSKYMQDAKESQAKVEARSLYIAANYLYAQKKYEGTIPTAAEIIEQADLGNGDNKVKVEDITVGKIDTTNEIAIKYSPDELTTPIVLPEKTPESVFTPSAG